MVAGPSSPSLTAHATPASVDSSLHFLRRLLIDAIPPVYTCLPNSTDMPAKVQQVVSRGRCFCGVMCTQMAQPGLPSLELCPLRPDASLQHTCRAAFLAHNPANTTCCTASTLVMSALYL